MDRVVHYSTLFCVLIFGLCEAYWEFKDDWPRNAPPMSKHDIEVLANASLLRTNHGLLESIKKFYQLIDNHQKEVTLKRNNIDLYLSEIASIEKDIATVANGSEKDRLKDKKSLIMDNLVAFIRSIPPRFEKTAKASSELYLRDIKSKQYMIEDIEYRKLSSLMDSEKGMSTRSRIEISLPTFSFAWEVPSNTRIYVVNDDQKQPASGVIDYYINNQRSASEFQLNVIEGRISEEFSGGGRLSGRIPPGTKLEVHNEDLELRPSSRYLVVVTKTAVKQVAIHLMPDGTRKFHQTINKVENATFKQETRTWTEYSNKTKSALQGYEPTVVDLNNIDEEVVLMDGCQSSLEVTESAEGQEPRTKKLICRNE